MGRDMLAQDYILKQLTASLIYPERNLGKKFWDKVYTKARQMYGTTQIPVNTFNKVWIVADKADVFERGNVAYVVGAHLKVMLEEDYLALSRHSEGIRSTTEESQQTRSYTIASQIVRAIILPEIEKEVNKDKNFAPLRQMFYSMILASWYKMALKDAIITQIYGNQSKVKVGVNQNDPKANEAIFQRYLQAYKKGVFNYIKEDVDQISKEPISKKYFSGGLQVYPGGDPSRVIHRHQAWPGDSAMTGDIFDVNVHTSVKTDAAMGTQTASQNLLGTSPQLGMTPQELAVEIEKEIKNPGSGRIPLIVTISDQHGTIDKFDKLLVDAFRSVDAGKNVPADFILDPDQPIAKQFKKLGIKLADFKGQLLFENLGDFMDRGPFGVKVFYRSKQLINAGLSDFVIGNHDQWMFMNLIGLHLPYYDNFEFYGYKDSYDTQKGGGDVRFLLRQKHLENPETRKAGWWAKKLAEHRQYYEYLQNTLWKNLDAEVNGEKGLYVQVTNGMDEEEKKKWSRTHAGDVWNKLRGVNPDVGDVFTGVKAVGLVSIVWWEDLLKEFKKIDENLYPAGQKNEKDLAVQEAWTSAIVLIEDRIIPKLKEILEENINPADGADPKWWYRIFEAINSQNYTSPEWWAQDWAYHKGWGPTVFKEINNTYYHGEPLVTVANYLDEQTDLIGVTELKEIARFFKQHYNLHVRNIMQTDLMHAFLPIDPKTGEFYFNYKSIHYQGMGGKGSLPYWEGLAAITRDIREAPNDESLIRTIYEAKTIINSWYADNTTEAKAIHVATAFQNIGVRKVAQANGIHRLITGHIPMHDYQKLPEDSRRIITGHLISTEDGTRTFAFSDGGMGERFGGGGKYIVESKDGFFLRGFPGKKSTEIVDNPATIIYKVDKTTGAENEKTVYKNDNVISREVFLSSVLKSIPSEKPHDDAMVTPGGIDFDRAKMQMNVNQDAVLGGVKADFDPAMAVRIKRQGFEGLEFNIQSIVPINNLSLNLQKFCYN